MIVVGLTGSIGMGKSVVAAMLLRLGVPVHDADAEVHRLLSPKGKGRMAVAAAFPYFSYPQIYGPKRKGIRAFKRDELAKIVFKDEVERQKLERILHSLVREAQNNFLRRCARSKTAVAVLEIPLLFETGGERLVHKTLVASAPFAVQKARVMARKGMTTERFAAILKAQMPDGEKCARADYVIHTGLGLAQTMKELKAALRNIKETAL